MSNCPISIKPSLFVLSIFSLTLALGACGRNSDDPSATEAKPSPAPEDHTPATTLPRTASPANARVFFANLADGDVVTNPVEIQFGISGMTVVKAGMEHPKSGHHHLIIDAPLPDLSLPIPVSENYVHFGDGSRVTEQTLEPGTHTLQMLLGDYLHIPHDPPIMSDVITIVVE